MNTLIDTVNIKKIEIVECDKCNKSHNVNEETFVTIYGNICLGLNGGIIGNNFVLPNERNFVETVVLKQASIYCLGCFKQTIDEMIYKIEKPIFTNRLLEL